MTRLLRATSIVGLPVVTLSGESPLEVKDVVFDSDAGDVLGFTLRKHGFLGGPVAQDLAWRDVHGLGPDAVIIADEAVLAESQGIAASGGDVIGDRVITAGGTDLGEVVEVIIESGTAADVVGFEIKPADDLRTGDNPTVFIPLPDTMAISSEKLIVPDSAADYISDDLTGFGSAVEDFRARLAEDG